MSKKKSTIQKRLRVLKSVAGQLRIGGYSKPVQEAVGEAIRAVEAIPNPAEIEVTPAAVAEAKQAAVAAINAAWDTIDGQQRAWAVEKTLDHQDRLTHLEERAKYFQLYLKYFPKFRDAYRTAADNIAVAMGFKGKPEDLAKLTRQNGWRLRKAWEFYINTREAGGLKASVVFDGSVGPKLDEAEITVERLVKMTNERVLALDGIGPAALEAIREKVPAPGLKGQVATAAKANGGNPRSIGARVKTK